MEIKNILTTIKNLLGSGFAWALINPTQKALFTALAGVVNDYIEHQRKIVKDAFLQTADDKTIDRLFSNYKIKIANLTVENKRKYLLALQATTGSQAQGYLNNILQLAGFDELRVFRYIEIGDVISSQIKAAIYGEVRYNEKTYATTYNIVANGELFITQDDFRDPVEAPITAEDLNNIFFIMGKNKNFVFITEEEKNIISYILLEIKQAGLGFVILNK